MESRILWWVAETARVRRFARMSRFALAISVICICLGATASAAPFVYVVTLNQQFGTIDLANGKFQPIGNGTPDGLTNLVWLNGSLFSLAITGNDAGDLVRINPATGQETVIGQTGLGFLAFDLAGVRGKLYLTDFGNNLYSVDPTTGIATPISATGIPPDPNIPFTFNSDGTFNLCDEGLYGVAGKLYATFDSFAIDPTQTPPTRTHGFVAPNLYRIDPFTGVATLIAQTDWQLSALFEVNGSAYAFRAVFDGFDLTFGFPIGHAELVTLDLATGKTVKIADIDPSLGPIFGAAPVRIED